MLATEDPNDPAASAPAADDVQTPSQEAPLNTSAAPVTYEDLYPVQVEVPVVQERVRATQELPHGAYLEHWHQNERMRHIPAVPWIIEKLDQDIRRRLDKLLVPWSDVGAADPRHAAIETELRAVCRALDRVADIAKRGRSGHPPNELVARVRWGLDHAVQSLRSTDTNTLGRRFPFQTLERSSAEPLWGAVLTVIQHVQNLVPLIREVEPDIDERLYEGWVNLVEPMRREPMA